MLNFKIKDNLKRKKFKNVEKKILFNKFILRHFLNLNSYKNKFLILKFFKFKLQNSKRKIVNRCIISNRSRGNFRVFGFSRFVFRKLILFNFIPGWKKSIW